MSFTPRDGDNAEFLGFRITQRIGEEAVWREGPPEWRALEGSYQWKRFHLLT